MILVIPAITQINFTLSSCVRSTSPDLQLQAACLLPPGAFMKCDRLLARVPGFYTNSHTHGLV